MTFDAGVWFVLHQSHLAVPLLFGKDLGLYGVEQLFISDKYVFAHRLRQRTRRWKP